MNLDHLTELSACPLCENGLKRKVDITDRDTFYVHCDSCGTYEITEECMVFIDMQAKLRQRAEKLSEWVRKKNAEGEKWPTIKTLML